MHPENAYVAKLCDVYAARTAVLWDEKALAWLLSNAQACVAKVDSGAHTAALKDYAAARMRHFNPGLLAGFCSV